MLDAHLLSVVADQLVTGSNPQKPDCTVTVPRHIWAQHIGMPPPAKELQYEHAPRCALADNELK